MTIGRSAVTSPAARPIDLSASWNASDAELGARLHPLYGSALGRLPEGDQAFRGLPFRLGSRAVGARWIAVGDGLTVELGQGSGNEGRASHLVVAHFSDSWREPAGGRPAGMPVGWVLPTGEPLARYEVLFGAGRSQVLNVRRRFEIADGVIGWGFLPFAAVGHQADEALRLAWPVSAPGGGSNGAGRSRRRAHDAARVLGRGPVRGGRLRALGRRRHHPLAARHPPRRRPPAGGDPARPAGVGAAGHGGGAGRVDRVRRHGRPARPGRATGVPRRRQPGLAGDRPGRRDPRSACRPGAAPSRAGGAPRLGTRGRARARSACSTRSSMPPWQPTPG